MRHGSHWQAAICLAGLCGALSGGCGSTAQSRFYLLTPSVEPAKARTEEGQGPLLGIGPVQLPEYVRRPQIVTRATDNEILAAEYDRWAEQLETRFPVVIGENLSNLLATDRIVFFPRQGTEPVDWRIVITVTRFDAGPGGDFTLDALWRLSSGKAEGPRVSRKSHIAEPVGKDAGYADIALAASRAAGKLSRQIAAAISETE